jgi:hypothetical protein
VSSLPQLQLTPQHIERLERLASRNFAIVAFPLYASAVGIRKGNCAALLKPLPDGTFSLFGEPSYLIEGNLAVRITRNNRHLFVFKKLELEATPQRLSELDSFHAELTDSLSSHV